MKWIYALHTLCSLSEFYLIGVTRYSRDWVVGRNYTIRCIEFWQIELTGNFHLVSHSALIPSWWGIRLSNLSPMAHLTDDFAIIGGLVKWGDMLCRIPKVEDVNQDLPAIFKRLIRGLWAKGYHIWVYRWPFGACGVVRLPPDRVRKITSREAKNFWTGWFTLKSWSQHDEKHLICSILAMHIEIVSLGKQDVSTLVVIDVWINF